jgi:hypothetical protein
MKGLGLLVMLASLVPATALTGTASAGSPRMEKSLQKLDPSTRFEQVCDVEAMARIQRDRNRFRPDRAVTGALSEAKITGHTMQGAGGAVRSGGKWYQFSFVCRASDDFMKVHSFDYQLGAVIPEDKWEDYGLWR